MKTFTICLTLSLFLVMATPAYAVRGMEKLGYGVKEMVTAPLALGTSTARHIDSTGHHHGALMGTVAGIIAGSGEMLNQGLRGLIYALTFPFDSDC